MIHFVLHDAKDTVAVVVVENVKAGMELSGWIMDEDKMTNVVARSDIPIGHKVALKDMAVGDTVWKYGIDMGKVVAPIKAGMALKGWIMDEDRMVEVQARQDIPIGHKVALKDMAPGDTVIKYGIDMGKVVAPIRVGEHAHVHNIKTKRW